MGKDCLTINPSKLQAIIITLMLLKVLLLTSIDTKLNFSTIAISDSTKCILIDFKLLLRDHIYKVQNKLSRTIGILHKLQNFFPSCLLKNFTLPCFICTYFTILQYGVLYVKVISNVTDFTFKS